MRRLFLLMGASATVAGGIWLHHARQMSTNCVPHTAGNPGFGVTANCLNQVGVEYVSFGIMIAGLFIIVLTLVLMDRDRAGRYKAPKRDDRHIGTPGEDPAVRLHKYGPSTTPSASPTEGPAGRSKSPTIETPSGPTPEP
ncbi:MAG TPA: hypothetical protein VND83_05210 [Acidimicrobiales bacterium]|nr:hypothetical protein [Acidimicrobiales bacterium]